MCKAVSIMINWKLKQAKGARRWAHSRGRPEGGVRGTTVGAVSRNNKLEYDCGVGG